MAGPTAEDVAADLEAFKKTTIGRYGIMVQRLLSLEHSDVVDSSRIEELQEQVRELQEQVALLQQKVEYRAVKMGIIGGSAEVTHDGA